MKLKIVFIVLSLFNFSNLVYAETLGLNKSSINILCIGDSITQGGGNYKEEYTFRLPLYRLLINNGLNVDFIGTRKNGLNPSFEWPNDFDPDHEGYYGATTNAVRDALKINLSNLPVPDIAIIDLGSNDENKNSDLTVIPALEDIIHQLRTRNPEIKIILIQIPGMYSNFRMHFFVWRMKNSLSQDKSPIITIPLYLTWNTHNDTFDGEHPNIQGQNKIADSIYSELKPLLKAK